MNYLGGGLLASNLVLTFLPVTMYALLVYLRVRKEERVLIDTFGQRYIDYMQRTGRLIPRIRTLLGDRNDCSQ